jgi:LuxR family maltose regulon positive regulatory protein
VDTPILTTKLYKPSLRPQSVPRPRLIERLERGLGGKLTLISAPAGYGKTTLMSEWISQSRIPFCWLSLDQNDNDLGRFLTYLVASLQSIDLDVDAHLLSLPQLQKTKSFGDHLIPLINQVAATSNRFALILDDYHLIHENEIHTTLSYLLEHLPTNLHLVIATRADPPLPLARLRARGQMTEIRTADLRFSYNEGEKFLNRLQGLGLSSENIEALVDRTGGWIAALQMASVALKGKEDLTAYIRDFSGSRDYIADYLTAEVIDEQPEEIYNFLLKTSILERLSGPLCDIVTGRENSQEILKHLRDENLFLISLDDESHWFSYHKLFSDLLQQRLIEAQPNLLPKLYLMASQWFEIREYINEAIDYALKGNLIRRGASLIEKQAEATLMRSEMATFIAWMRRLPDEVIFENKSLCIYYAWALLVHGEDPHAAMDYLDQIPSNDDALRARRDIVQSIEAVYRKQIPEAIRLAQQGLANLAAEDFFFHQIAAWNLSALLFISGDQNGGARMLEEVARVSIASKNQLVAIIALCRLGTVHIQRGDLYYAKDLFIQALEIASADTKQLPPVACEAMLGLGKVYWEWYQLDTAKTYLLEGIELSKRWRETTGLEGQIILAHIYQYEGESGRARLMVEAARNTAQISGIDTDDIYVASETARLELKAGQLRAALDWANKRELKKYINDNTLTAVPKGGADIILRYELLNYARILIAQNMGEAALHLLNDLLQSFEGLGQTGKILETHLLIAHAWEMLGKTDQALAALIKALTLGEDGRFVRIFLDEGPEIIQLVETVYKPREFNDYTQQILAAHSSLRGEPIPHDRIAGLVEPLTEREIQVLKLLVSELSVPEIAAQIHISPSTLRTHVRNIYAKLGVHSRFEAITIGKELELI